MGSAIRLQAFEYELRGHRKKRKSTSARPGEAYLPKSVDRDTDSFAIAADQSPDISWLSGHYARILRSPAGRQGVGAQRFLVKRARTTPHFFLVVISGIEGVDAQPRLRVIVDPLSQLQPTESGSITLSGVRSATSLTYDFAPNDDTAQASEEDETGVSAE